MPGSSRTRFFTPLLVAVVPLALACGGDAGDGTMEGDGSMQSEQPAMESSGQSANVELTDMNDSGVTGDVEFTVENGTLTVATLANSLGGPGDYPTHIHQGTCDAPGSVVVPLEASVAHEPGIGEGETEVELSELDPSGSYLVMIHALQGDPVACAEVPSEMLRSS